MQTNVSFSLFGVRESRLIARLLDRLLFRDIIQTGFAELVHNVSIMLLKSTFTSVLRRTSPRTVAACGEIRSRHGRVGV